MGLVSIATTKGKHLALRVKRPSERRSVSRSAARALDILEALGEARTPLRAMDIARILDLTPSTTNQLLKTMVDSAHLLFDARTKTYRPSPRLAAIGAWVTEMYGATGGMADLVRDLQAQTGLVVTLTTPNDLFMQVIDSASPDGQVTRRGLQVSLFGSAIGSAYLSTLSEREIRRLADRARISEAELPAILESVAAIRASGRADGPMSDSEIWSIAVPLPEQGLHLQAVLGVAGPADVVRERTSEYFALMQAAIARWLTASEAPAAGPA